MTDHKSGANWFLAQIKPNSHRIAERNLAQQGFTTFIPMHEETRRTRGKFVTQTRPLFPGYLFVALNKLQGGWRAVNSTYGISRLVSIGHDPTPVPAALVTQLQLRCSTAPEDDPAQSFGAGDQVMVTKGPFSSFLATVESMSPERRVWLLMELMGNQTRVAVDPSDLRLC